MEMSDELTVKFEHLKRIVKSEYAPAFHPFLTYLDSLPKWNGTDDGIRVLSMTVQVKGDEGRDSADEQDCSTVS